MFQCTEKEAVTLFMKLFSLVRGACHGRRTLNFCLWSFWVSLFTTPLSGAEPTILGIEHRDANWVLRVAVPPGVVRVVLEGCRREDLKAWIPKASARVSPSESVLEFYVESDARMEMFRVRADATDPLPASWYSGTSEYPAEPSNDPAWLQRPLEDAGSAAGGGAPVGRSVIESDIWVQRGDTLYFFNEMRGLQVIGLENPDAPVLHATFRLPGSGERMYLADDRHAVLLAQDPCRQWGTDAESAVWVIDTGAVPPVEKARLPLKGRIVESRWVGSALYVATETWEPVQDGTGTWRSGTRIASFDFSKPEAPVERRPLWVAGSGNVVTATDRFLFVAVADYSKPWPWSTDLEVLDITAENGTVDTWVRIPLSGRVPDKFKIDVWEDTLRVVTESVESPESGRMVTVLETYRLTDPRSMSPLPTVRLDRLELARGERLFATRFDGPRAYIVTFLRVDPLWILDLGNPSDIRVAGEVEVPGWSTYLRPMGDRLMTLGVDDARGSRVAVQWFDVSNAQQPFLLAKVPLGEDSSWSEANHDEKALGVFDDAGLILVPVSEWRNDRSVQGVHLVDFTRERLTRRGFLPSDGVTPRRTTLHRDRLVAISGRSLVSADISDRDWPEPKGSLELAYPVERVLVLGEHLIEFQSGKARVRRMDALDADQQVDLGDLPLLGAVLAGTKVHLLQGRPADIQWAQDPVSQNWVGHTNAGVLRATTWDVSEPPKMTRLGESTLATQAPALVNAQPLWPNPELLVWALNAHAGYPWLAGVGALDIAVGGPLGRFAPWWGFAQRRLVAVAVPASGAPRILSEGESSDAEAVGETFAAGNLVYMTHRITESEVVGTNWVVESAWFPRTPISESKIFQDSDGSSTTNLVLRQEGEWRPVTNAYPVLRWWDRHQLDVWDYSGGGADPIRRPPVSVPGALEGISHGGTLLAMSSWKTDRTTGRRSAWLDAGAYDGVSVRALDSVRIAEESRSETYAMATRGEVSLVARGGWETNARHQLEAWRLGSEGKWLRMSTNLLDGVPEVVQVFGDMVLVRSRGVLDAFRVQAGGALTSEGRVEIPGCFSGDLSTGDGDSLRGVWLPMWDYGTVRAVNGSEGNDGPNGALTAGSTEDHPSDVAVEFQ